MQGLILAAGLGSRLKHLTKNNTKSMIEVNGISLIERMLRILDKKNLNRIVVVTGYKREEFIKFIKSLNIQTEIILVNNDVYYETNNIYSMYLAKNLMTEDDTITLESDLIFDERLIDLLIDDSRSNLALVSKYERWMDGTSLRINSKEEILDFISGKDFKFSEADNYYKTVNIYKFSKEFSKNIYFPFLETYMNVKGKDEYYEDVLKMIIDLKSNYISAKSVPKNYNWYEIDDEQDLKIAENIFSVGEEKLNKYQSTYGGYWRYNNLLDFCYLVNPYFPPEKMKDELKYNFNILLEQYPSGLNVNTSLVSKIYGIKNEHIVVGNGAAELIKSVMEKLEGNVGFIRPTFEEYPNRYRNVDSVVYVPNNENFKYDYEELIEFFSDKNLSALILINPDNPTGNYISKENIFKIIEWTNDNNITLILDESFVDFAVQEDSSFIYNDILEKYKNLIVVKSISKSYGVPGLRLGILATSNKDLIKFIKSDVSIWNINSFAEYYLQIYDKYKKDYSTALDKIKNARRIFINNLSEINEFRVIPSEANYVTIELLGLTSKDFCIAMLEKYNIFIKDLTPKISWLDKQFIRVAVRDEEDNDIFIEAAKDYILTINNI
ncbi:aminotransferase class I/II-fold pyridoxal phosphate-dependent enzyme [Gemelliphila palaticanis]|uniref:Aminotransferase n=1 Tax=Gemelliphila palaticanis TaxID=81950 RepID=A0ABX2SYQ6_9BACL|nr:aminotransferase class I/II-fold pyridoxal phosphate-dependent enzyme [Gemella palaticanis]MBF0715440.1 aminotransferase class I/II-fold pyridoxal phosphate-dependent enzyme [Gemella palaticanis]NYS47370.1 aminotransferase class I/II-fold pyridoxal phosphate-dependent enzyme [Gemella palaticanis]